MDTESTASQPEKPSHHLPRRSRLKARFTGLNDLLAMLIVLAVLVVLFGLLSRHFWTWRTVQSVVNQIPDLTVIAVGMTLVLIAGGIDLSVGSVLALSGTVLGIAMSDWGWPLFPAVLLCLSVGTGCGLASGLVTVRWSIPSFIVTLGMLEVARGAAYRVSESQTKYIGPQVERLAQPLPGLGVSFAFLAAIFVVLAGQVLLTRTVWGRYLVAVGANEPAARFSGIGTRRIKLATFVLSGFLAAAGAVFQVARLSSADPNGGVGMELAAIAAVVIGGTSLIGGQGSVLRSFLGVLIVASLQTGLAQVGTTEPTKRIVTGIIIVLAVIADVHRRSWTKAAIGRWTRVLPASLLRGRRANRRASSRSASDRHQDQQTTDTLSGECTGPPLEISDGASFHPGGP
jgi:ribose transport system permease protein